MQGTNKKGSILALAIFLVLTSVLPTRAGEPGRTLTGTCSGEVIQGDGANKSEKYPVSMQLQGYTGTVSYPGLGCGGTLSFMKSNGTDYWYKEHITYGTNRCSDGGTIQLTIKGKSIEWFWWAGDKGGGTAYCSLTGQLKETPVDTSGKPLHGSGKGTVLEEGPAKSIYKVELELHGKKGTIKYPDLGCTGTLVFLRSEGNMYWYKETITSGSQCSDGGNIKITVVDNTITLSRTGNSSTMNGVLKGLIRE